MALLEISIAMLTVLVVLLLLRHCVRFPRFSFALSVGLMGLGLASFALGEPSATDVGPGANIIREASSIIGLRIFVLASASAATGILARCVLTSRALPQVQPWLRGSDKAGSFFFADTGAHLQSLLISRAPKRTGLVSLISATLLSVYVGSRGVSNLIGRQNYNFVAAIGTLSSLSGVIILTAYVLAALGQRSLVNRVLQFICYLVVFSSGSRLLAILPLIGVVIHAFSDGVKIRRVVVTALASIVLLIITLGLRQSSFHGLIPSLQGVFVHFSSIFSSGLEQSIRNVLICVPLAAWTRQFGSVPSRDLWVSVNPLPGSTTGWPQLAPLLRAHQFIPFSAMGEMASLGGLYVFGFWFVLGFLFASAELMADRIGSVAVTSLLLAPCLMIYVFSLEYNFRSVMRFIYLEILIVIAVIARTSWSRRPAERSSDDCKRLVARPGNRQPSISNARDIRN